MPRALWGVGRIPALVGVLHAEVRVGEQLVDLDRKVDIRLPGKGISNSRGARPVY